MPTLISLKDHKDQQFPVIPIRNGVVFPDTESVLVFGRNRSIAAIDSAFKNNSLAVVVMQKDPNINDPSADDLYTVGTMVKIEKILKNNIGQGQVEINALIRGMSRIRIGSYVSYDPFLMAQVTQYPQTIVEDDETRALVNHITTQLKRAVSFGKSMDFVSFMKITGGLSPAELTNQVASVLDVDPLERQKLLEETDLKKQMKLVVDHLSGEIRVLEIEKNIDSKTQEKFDKHFRKTVLEERLKTIEKELGKEGENREIREYYTKIKKAKMPEEIEKKAKKELKRLSQMSSYNPEASYVRSYLDWLTDLPWSVVSANNVDIKRAEKILSRDHYGLKKIKERIVEYLAVMKLRDERNKQHQAQGESPRPKNKKREIRSSTILCLVGPPGVGKTSVGKSIARALKREFVKMSLGGIRDEAEIRGHRRTYVGSLPGRIIQGIKNAGTRNPVFMLDEIDKIGNDFRGDPSSALLETLDPEQNFAFEDHYLEVPFDLSDVFFITTCNVLDTIPPALRDRLEVIRFAGYTEEEKFNIAEQYLVGKQREINGLDKKQIQLTDKAIHHIIQRYTREAGVRNLERQIAAVMRKVARQIAEGKKKHVVVGVSEVRTFLGPEKFSSTIAEKKDDVGMVTALAWTEAGGEILFIEVALMPGKGNLLLTGQLGDVMKESCQAAMSYIRSKWKQFGLKKDFYNDLDVHIHVPEGAVPKDGPSAGLAITTAIVSALTKVPVRKTVAMTGEITLRGRALEIGGVKEKVIAAHRAGLKTLVLPKDNTKDLYEIPAKVLKDLDFKFVSDVGDVLEIALKKQTGKKAKKK
ncbi:endopeptidase La [Candidatus Roizmanbacteria bacterium RIFCSPLOWO2_01_FULL_45_11]|uniref:Lon protease n=1 Tax=Candidatus Roizmanbacteria bacterium RIFCSPLOWO2_01_FULL_45_11 TaxID=1802070 RepID=A0A1F7JGZ2_9BACT|nr:MAG: endopeptidase La [Candidatus Roizmanbacteria bacterium RIFCSPLOWO2_01_FULL_45_11]